MNIFLFWTKQSQKLLSLIIDRFVNIVFYKFYFLLCGQYIIILRIYELKEHTETLSYHKIY